MNGDYFVAKKSLSGDNVMKIADGRLRPYEYAYKAAAALADSQGAEMFVCGFIANLPPRPRRRWWRRLIGIFTRNAEVPK